MILDKLNMNAFIIPKWRYFEGHGINRAGGQRKV